MDLQNISAFVVAVDSDFFTLGIKEGVIYNNNIIYNQ